MCQQFKLSSYLEGPATVDDKCKMRRYRLEGHVPFLAGVESF